MRNRQSKIEKRSNLVIMDQKESTRAIGEVIAVISIPAILAV